MLKVITPEKPDLVNPSAPHLFLAGSIEQGKATNWQETAIDFFGAQATLPDLVIINPRRENWDASFEQSIKNVDFNWQVSFELEHLEKADAVVMWLEPGTLSPISLFELGLMTGWTSAGLLNKLVIGCPPGFWRRGNVEVISNRYRLRLVDSFDEMLQEGYNVLRRNHDRRNTTLGNFEDSMRRIR